MDKLQLEYFLSVANTLNISKSAEQLYISQSSLSQTIKRLETELGYTLFTRSGKHISLNQNGIIFLNCVEKIKDIFENALEEIAEVNDMTKHEISLNMKCASYFLPRLMLYLGERLPDTSFHISQQNISAIPGKEADLMILASQEPLNLPCAALLMEENILLAVPQKHPLFHSTEIKLWNLQQEHFISLNSNWSLAQAIQTECNQKGLYPKIMIEVDNPDILRRLMVEQIGLAFIPEQTWGDAFTGHELALRNVSDFSMKRYIYLIWKEGFLRKDIKNCIQYIRDFFFLATQKGPGTA